MDGAAFLTKAELMRRADASGLVSRPGAIYGALRVLVQGIGRVAPGCPCSWAAAGRIPAS